MKKLDFKIILNFLSILMLFMAGFMLLCVPVGLIYDEESYKGIGLAALFSLLLGGLLYVFTKKNKTKLSKRDGYVIVTFGWLVMVMIGTLPYLFSIPFMDLAVLYKNNINFTNSFFESMSGFTTTGATVLSDIEIMPKGLLLWRSMTHWIGGMGIIVLTIAILPLLGIGGMQLFVAEAPGINPDKLHPRITETAKRLWFIYVFLTFILLLLLWALGMNFFDAINHAMSTMSTGGFSTKNNSMAYWNDAPFIQYIICLFMFFAGINFVLFYAIFKKKFIQLYRNEEFKFYSFIIIVSTLIVTLTLFFKFYTSTEITIGLFNYTNLQELEYYFRQSLFHVITVITTTGFVSEDFTNWTPFLSLLFFGLMFTGAMAGSTSGGVKTVRHLIMLKNARNEFKRLLHSNAIIPLRFNGKSVNHKVVYNVLAFFITYIIVFIFGTLILSFLDSSNVASDNEVTTYLGTTISMLGNIGPALGKYNPVSNFSEMAASAKWFSCFLMLLGRLELFTVLVLFTPFFWKK